MGNLYQNSTPIQVFDEKKKKAYYSVNMIYYSLCAALCFSSFPLIAVVPDRIPCVDDLEVHFFVPESVNQSLNFYGVREELWVPINIDLQERSKEVPQLMIKASAYMVPNPIEYPMQKLQTVKLLRKVLFDVFKEVLLKYYVGGQEVTVPAFNYIFVQQKERLVDCFGEEVQKIFENEKK